MTKKTLTRIIGEGTFWITFTNIALKFVGLMTTFFVLRRLSIYEYGLVTLTLSVIPLVGIILLPGLSSTIISDMGVEKGKGNLGAMRQIFSNFFKLQVTLSVIAWAVVFFGADIIARFYDGQISSLLKIISVTFLVAPFRSILGIVFNVYFKFAEQSLYPFVEELLKLLLVLFFFFVLEMGPDGLVLSIILSQILVMFFMYPFFRKIYNEFKDTPITESIPFLDILRAHRTWGVLSNYLSDFGKNIRLWIIKFMLGTEAVGLFNVAQSLIGHASSLMPLSRIITPIIPQYIEQREKFLRIIDKSIKYQFIGFSLIGIIVFFAFPMIISWFFPNYQQSIPLFSVMLLTLISSSVATVFSPVFYALKAQKSLFFSVCVRTILIVTFLPIFIYFFGIKGVAYEFVFNAFCFIMERYFVLKKLMPDLKINIRDFFRFDDYDRFLINKTLTLIKWK